MAQQGEADHFTATETYRTQLSQVFAAIRARTVAPIFVAQSSICNSEPAEPVRAAQRAVLDDGQGIVAGPDTDVIDRYLRYDGCHLSTGGLDKHADLWVESLRGWKGLKFR